MSEKMVQLNEEATKKKGRPAGRSLPPVPLSLACPLCLSGALGPTVI